MIRDTLKNSKIAIRFRAMVATPRVVGGILNDGCQMIHYAGHREGGCLSFESDDERQCGIMEAFQVGAVFFLLIFGAADVETCCVFCWRLT